MQSCCVLLEEKLKAEAAAAFKNNQAQWHKKIKSLSSILLLSLLEKPLPITKKDILQNEKLKYPYFVERCPKR